LADGSDAASVIKSPTIPEEKEPAVAKEQKITPFDVEGGVDEHGKETGM
jgi:tryptophanyl-tRNA synthetase